MKTYLFLTMLKCHFPKYLTNIRCAVFSLSSIKMRGSCVNGLLRIEASTTKSCKFALCVFSDTINCSVRLSSVLIHSCTAANMLISSCVWTSTYLVRVAAVTLCTLIQLVMPELGSDARLARCHRVDWTGAVCCSDKSTFRPGQWGADSLGCVYHSASLSLTPPPVYCVCCLTVSLIRSQSLKARAHAHPAGCLSL